MDTPKIDESCTQELLDTKYIHVYQLGYEDGTRYFDASRRPRGDLLALKPDEELRSALPDAVSCCLVLVTEEDEPRMVLFREFRYPAGQYLLSIPSGLIDARDRSSDQPLVQAMVREIGEECGLALGEGDHIRVINPLLFNSPGMTDESTALLCAVAYRPDASCLSQAGAEGSERFGGFELMTKGEVRRVLRDGRDPDGRYYPMVAWAAMTYFACDLWREDA